jgi:hypothetical protein
VEKEKRQRVVKNYGFFNLIGLLDGLHESESADIHFYLKSGKENNKVLHLFIIQTNVEIL